MTVPNIEDLMKFIESDINGYFYTRDRESTSEIRYSKKGDSLGKGWGWRIEGIGKYQEFTADTALDLFELKRVDFNLMHSELLNKVTVIAAYHKMMTGKVQDLLGTQLYDESMKKWDDFGTELKSTVGSLLRKNNLKLVKD